MISRTLRSLLFSLHKWLGLHLAIFFGFMFLSGTVLVFSDELEAIVHPTIWTSPAPEGQRATFGEIYDSVSDAFPQGTAAVLQRQPQKWLSDRTFAVTGWGEKVVVWTDPITAEVVEVTKNVNFRSVLRQLHDSLLVPRRIGFVLVSATSLLLLTSLVTGLITYRRFWKGFLRLPNRKSGTREYQGGMHRVLAVWVALFLLLNGITGAFFLATGLGMNGFVPSPPAAQSRETIRPENFTGKLIDAAEIAAHNSLAGFSPATMIPPNTPKDGIRFSGPTDAFGSLRGASSVSVDPATLDVLAVIQPSEFRGIATIKSLMKAIHFGEWLGNISRVIWVIFGISSFYLMLSGARIHVARTQALANESNKNGSFIKGLGIFKWAYLATIVVIIAMAALQFGPLAKKWANIAPTMANGSNTKLHIFGRLREGKQMQLALIVHADFAEKVLIQSPRLGTQTLEFNPTKNKKRFEFQSFAGSSDNIFSVTLTDSAGGTQVITYNLGAAIW